MALDPFIIALLESYKSAGRPAISDGTPDQARAFISEGRAALGPGPEMAQVRNLQIPTQGGYIPGRLLIPNDHPQGLTVYVHGGGWVILGIDDYDTLARQLAHESGSAVLLIDYRLAPEHKFPSGLQDTEDALLWADAHSAELLGQSGAVPLVAIGDSAGGNLVTVALRRLRQRLRAAAQILIYPVTDCDFNTQSYLHESEGMLLQKRDMIWFFDHYGPPDRSHPDVSPLQAKDLTGFPPTFVLTAEHDVLRDEGRSYAKRLSQSGVAVQESEYKGAIHGFIVMHNLYETARRAVSDCASAIRAAVAPK